MTNLSRTVGACIACAGLVMMGACGDSSQPPTPKPSAEEPTPAAPDPEPAPAPAPDPEPPAAEGPGAPDVAAGASDYKIYCASCHGETGAADGPLAATLDPKPAAHDDADYMNALSDDHLFKVIQEGGPAVGKSQLMAPWGGSLSDQQIRNLVAFLRTLAG